jgi:hypothetical protein
VLPERVKELFQEFRVKITLDQLQLLSTGGASRSEMIGFFVIFIEGVFFFQKPFNYSKYDVFVVVFRLQLVDFFT